MLPADDPRVQVSSSESNEFLLLLNTTASPTDDLRVRRALALAVDRQLLIDSFRAGLTEVASSQLSPTHPFWVETDYPGFDLDEARRLIDDYEAEIGPARLTLTSVSAAPYGQMVEVIASFWEDAGVEVTIEIVGQGALAGRAIADDFDAIVWLQFASPDPDGDYVFFHSAGGLLNWSNLVDPEIDEALDVGRESADESIRAEAYASFQDSLAGQIPMLWIDHLSGIEAIAFDATIRGLDEATLPGNVKAEDLTFGSYHGYGHLWQAAD